MLIIFIKQRITDLHYSEETCNNESFVSKVKHHYLETHLLFLHILFLH